MKNKVFSISLIFISVVMLVTAASAAQITKIGRGHDPAIYGNVVTWSEDAGSIHVYDLTAQKGITISSSSSSHPAIYGNKIVWHDESSVTPRLTVYDIPSGTMSYITEDVDSTSFPAIYGNRIVWSSNGNVYMRDISTSTQTQVAVGISPDIYDTKVVYAFSVEVPESDYHGIRMYDIGTKEAITICSSGDDDAPHMYGNKIIWSDRSNRLGHIRMYDTSTKETIDVTSGNTYSDDPVSPDAGDDTGFCAEIYGDKIVYAKCFNDQFGNTGVYVYNLSTAQSTQVFSTWRNLYATSNILFGTGYNLYVTPNIYNNTIVWGFADPRITDAASNDIDVCNLAATVTTAPQPPVASFTSNATFGSVPLSVTFNDASTGTPNAWYWDFGDGDNSIDRNPAHTYSAAGKYTARLTVSNANGTDSKLAAIIVSEKLVTVFHTANFSSNVTSGYAPLSVQFNDSSDNATGWYWYFGDRATSTEQNPQHTYSTMGNYTVNLTASNSKGTDSKFAIITVSEQTVPILPKADFNSNLVSGFAPLDVQFTDASQNATGWNWDFGDGYTSTEQNPQHTFFLAGTHLVSLIVSNINGYASKGAAITVIEQSSSSGGGSSGGSGGAGGSPEPQSNVETKELSLFNFFWFTPFLG
jgi:beta propeller repeat protein